MKAKNPAAVKLGRLGKGKPKRFSLSERRRRAELMRRINQERLAKLLKKKD
jgi:hypothetical protein